MRNPCNPLVTLSVCATLVACGGPGSHDPSDAGPPDHDEAAADPAGTEPFTLAVGEAASVDLEDGQVLTVRFLEVSADSRCPTDATCVWEGDAAVAVETARAGVERVWVLHTPGDRVGPRMVEGDGWRLELVGLEPAPVTGEEIAPEDYRAVLVVR